jgi:hypothetical protein
VYSTGDDQVIIQWSTNLTAQYYRNIHPMFELSRGNPLVGVGDDEGVAICYKQELHKGRGEEVRFQKLWDANVTFTDATVAIEGTEVVAEDTVYSVKLGHIRGGVQWKLLFDLQKTQADKLKHQTWALALGASQHLYFSFLGHLMGYRNGTKASPTDVTASSDWQDYQNRNIDFSQSARYLGQKPSPPDDSSDTTKVPHIYRCGSATAGARIVDDSAAGVAKPDLADLITISQRTSAVNPALVAPMKVDGRGYFPWLLSLEMIETIKSDTNINQYVHDFAMQGGEIRENPIFTGSTFRFQRLLGIEIEKPPPGIKVSDGSTVSGTQRSAVLGCGSLYIAVGQSNSPTNHWFLVTDTRDGKQNRYWHAHSIIGCGSPHYTDPVRDNEDRDHGKLVVCADYTQYSTF